MYCEIARNLDETAVATIRDVEQDLGLTVVAFTCRSLDPAREERLQAAMAELGPVLRASPARLDGEQLSRLRDAEDGLGLSLIAVGR